MLHQTHPVPCLRPNLGIWALVLDPIDQRLVFLGPERALDLFCGGKMCWKIWENVKNTRKRYGKSGKYQEHMGKMTGKDVENLDVDHFYQGDERTTRHRTGVKPLPCCLSVGWGVMSASHPSVPGLLTFFSLPSASSAFTLSGKSPISQLQLAGRNGTGPSIARIGAREAENGSKESATCAWFTSSYATYLLILCWFISVRDLQCTFYPVHLSFPTSFAVSYSSCHYLEEGKKQQHPFCTPNKGIDWNIGASLAPQISPAGQVVLESTVDMS